MWGSSSQLSPTTSDLGSSSQPPLLTLDLGGSSWPFLHLCNLALSAAAPDLGRGVAPLVVPSQLPEELPRSVGAQYATRDQWRNNSRKNEGMEPKQKHYPVEDRTGDRSKVRCCKEQYCIGTWSVRSMNQGKLEVVKQEVARVNIDILGISELQWTGMGEFNSDDHYIYYCGQESLRRNGIAMMVNKRV